MWDLVLGLFDALKSLVCDVVVVVGDIFLLFHLCSIALSAA
jgi:hypothetical protein